MCEAAVDRMLVLMRFFRENGCCRLCALRCAIVQVEKEAGRESPYNPPTPPHESCAKFARECYHRKPARSEP